MKKLKMKIPVILPQVPDEKDACIMYEESISHIGCHMLLIETLLPFLAQEISIVSIVNKF